MGYLTLYAKAKLGCKICDKCCINRGDIKLTPINVIEISRYMNISIEDFLDRYTQKLEDEPPELVLKAVGKRATCILNDEKTNMCKVHSVKPMQCVTFPLIPVDLKKDIFYNQNSCPYGAKEEIKVIDWLNGKDGIYLKYKKVYIDWINLIEEIQKKWQKLSKERQNEIYRILFYDYDNKKGNVKHMVRKNIKKVRDMIKHQK